MVEGVWYNSLPLLKLERILSRKIKMGNDCCEVFPQLGLEENRFILSALDIGDRVEINGKEFKEVSLGILAANLKVLISEAISLARNIVQKLKEEQIIINIPNKGKLYTQLVYEYVIYEDPTSLYIHWNTDVVHLLQGYMPNGSFFTLQSEHAKAPSNKRLCLIILLSSHLWKIRKEGKFLLTKAEIRRTLELEHGSYAEFKQINAKYIKPAVKAIAETDGVYMDVKVRSDYVEFREIKDVT